MKIAIYYAPQTMYPDITCEINLDEIKIRVDNKEQILEEFIVK